MTASAETLLAAIRHWPGVRVDVAESHAFADVRADGHAIARIDLLHRQALVKAPPDVVATLERVFPSARVTPAGLVFDLDDQRHASSALAAIRRRASVERVAWQYREQSP